MKPMTGRLRLAQTKVTMGPVPGRTGGTVALRNEASGGDIPSSRLSPTGHNSTQSPSMG